MGIVRFGAPQRLVLWARDAFGVRSFVETGTNRAGTAVWAADHFDAVWTIEGQQELYEANVRAHGHQANLHMRYGDSRTDLGQILAEVGGPAVVWLDAHWCGGPDETYGIDAQCPVLDEIAAVNRSRPDHVVLIDDARYFTAPPEKPNRIEDWPGLLEVAAALAAGPSPRYAVILDDVIVAVPLGGKARLVEYATRVEEPPPLPAAPALWRRAARRVLRYASNRVG